MTSFIIDPIRKFEIKGEVYPLKAAPLNATVANNQVVIAGIAGKTHRVMGYQAQGDAATGYFVFKGPFSGALFAKEGAPSNATGLKIVLPVIDSGYSDPGAGSDLLVDVTVAGVFLTVFYITYTS